MKAILETILELTERVEWKKVKTGYVLISRPDELLGVVILIKKYALKGIGAMDKAKKKFKASKKATARFIEKVRPFAKANAESTKEEKEC